MKLLDFLISIDADKFNELTDWQSHFFIWRKDLEENKLNALLRLPKPAQKKVLESFINQYKFKS